MILLFKQFFALSICVIFPILCSVGCTKYLALGIMSFLSQSSLVAAIAAINNMIQKYGALDSVFGKEQQRDASLLLGITYERIEKTE